MNNSNNVSLESCLNSIRDDFDCLFRQTIGVDLQSSNAKQTTTEPVRIMNCKQFGLVSDSKIGFHMKKISVHPFGETNFFEKQQSFQDNILKVKKTLIEVLQDWSQKEDRLTIQKYFKQVEEASRLEKRNQHLKSAISNAIDNISQYSMLQQTNLKGKNSPRN